VIEPEEYPLMQCLQLRRDCDSTAARLVHDRATHSTHGKFELCALCKNSPYRPTFLLEQTSSTVCTVSRYSQPLYHREHRVA